MSFNPSNALLGLLIFVCPSAGAQQIVTAAPPKITVSYVGLKTVGGNGGNFDLENGRFSSIENLGAFLRENGESGTLVRMTEVRQMTHYGYSTPVSKSCSLAYTNERGVRSGEFSFDSVTLCKEVVRLARLSNRECPLTLTLDRASQKVERAHYPCDSYK